MCRSGWPGAGERVRCMVGVGSYGEDALKLFEFPMSIGPLFCTSIIKAYSHQAKVNANVKKIKEQSEEIKEKVSNIKEKFSLSLSFCMSGPLRPTSESNGRRRWHPDSSQTQEMSGSSYAPNNNGTNSDQVESNATTEGCNWSKNKNAFQ